MATHSSILAWESHGGRSLVGYNPWGCKESDMTELHHFGNFGNISFRYTEEWFSPFADYTPLQVITK